jgi:hypothetical protein
MYIIIEVSRLLVEWSAAAGMRRKAVQRVWYREANGAMPWYLQNHQTPDYQENTWPRTLRLHQKLSIENTTAL